MKQKNGFYKWIPMVRGIIKKQWDQSFTLCFEDLKEDMCTTEQRI